MRFPLFFSVAVATVVNAAPQQSPILSLEGPFTPEVTCPPGDGYEWKRGHTPAKYTFWAIPRNARDVIGSADARTYRVGDTAIIYSRSNLTMTSDGLARHEMCHAMGWEHGEAPIGGGLWR